MKLKQILVNLAIIVFFLAVAVFCYSEGKARNMLIENQSFSYEGKTYDAFEAIEVTVDGKEPPLFLLEGDRGSVNLIGKSHVVVVEVLDENDKVIKTYRVPFKSGELKGKIINVVPLVMEKLPGWSSELKQ
jgi:hypothetical protein